VHTLSGAVFAALLAFYIGQTGPLHADALEKQPLTFVTSSGKHGITVEVADSDQERSAGLMFRRSLADDAGMIFLYPREEHVTMWMKNTYLPLDMIFVRRDGTIHRIEEHTEPFSESVISSNGKVLAVVEMKAGSASRLGLKPGDKIEHPAFR
jgi:uncharacterized membrane protein (UPF0127 family)